MSREPLWECPLPHPLLTQLLALADTPFLLDLHRPLWQRFEWPYSPSDDDPYGIRLQMPDGSLVIVQPHGSSVGCYVAPVCNWDGFEDRDDPEYSVERARYDRSYQELRGQVASALGPPLLTGTDPEPLCEYAIWQSRYALVIAQQAAFDLQFGIEVNLWLELFSGPLPTPPSPLIDWLVARDRARAGA